MKDSHSGRAFNPMAFLIGTPVVLAGSVIVLYKTALQYYESTLHRDKNKMRDLPIVSKSTEQTIMQDDEITPQVQYWAESTPNAGFKLNSHDGLSLYATAYTQPASNWVVVVHGYTGHGMQMVETAKQFYELGYNVLLPDCRGHGKSEGEYIGMGWHDRMDIIAWVRQIIDWDANSRIVLYGISMGAAAVMMASGETLPDNVICLIEDCGYTSVADEFLYHLKNSLKKPKFPIFYTVDWLCRIKAGFRFKEASALKQLKKNKLPILFIHGGKDYFVPTEMVYKLYDSAECEKELFIVPDAGHGVSYRVSQKPYWEKIKVFTSRYQVPDR